MGYLLGSIPTAYLLVRWKSGMDLRKAGSGNVGALNSYKVTGARGIAGTVLGVDFLKGALAVALARGVWPGIFPNEAAAGIFVVAGHNFPVWLRFKGGRGLATAAGVFSFISWQVVGIWMLCWVPGYWLTRDVNMGNVLATLVAVVAVLVIPESGLRGVIPAYCTEREFRLFAGAVFVVILLKHIDPVKEFLEKRSPGSNS